jgi:hypothetical protein
MSDTTTEQLAVPRASPARRTEGRWSICLPAWRHMSPIDPSLEAQAAGAAKNNFVGTHRHFLRFLKDAQG